MHQVKVHYDCQEKELLQKEIIHGEENKMKKILAIALLLTVALVAVFAVETRTSNAKLNYTVAVHFDPLFIITESGDTTKIPEEGITISEEEFGTTGEFEFDILDKTDNNVVGRHYTLTATCAEGWKRDNVVLPGKNITLTFAKADDTSDSTHEVTADGKLKVTFADKAIERSTGVGVKVGTLTARWAKFETAERLAGSYSATVVVNLLSN